MKLTLFPRDSEWYHVFKQNHTLRSKPQMKVHKDKGRLNQNVYNCDEDAVLQKEERNVDSTHNKLDQKVARGGQALVK